MGAVCSNNNQVVQDTQVKTQVRKNLRIKTGQSDLVQDRDTAMFSNQERMHEKLWKAIEQNDLKTADKFLDLNEIQNFYDPQGQTMLHYAASLGHVEVLMMLVERTSAKPDLVNAQLATPLHIACKYNHHNVVKFLIGCGVDVNTQDEYGQTPLLLCCIHGHRELLSLLVEASISGQLTEPIEVNLANHQGLTPLNCAAIKGDFDMVKCLIQRGAANVNLASPKGCTPLIYAGRGGCNQIVEYLIEKKASALKQDNAGGTVLHHAIEKGHAQVLETLLSLGVDVYSAVEIADNAGRTPLFEAVEDIQNEELAVKMIKLLVDSKQDNGFGANPNILNYSGQTPLFSAARSQSLLAVSTLLEAGADPDLNSGEVVKPEDEPENEQFDSLEEQYFLEAFKNCMTPLHVACVLGNEEIALQLVKSGADPNLKSNIKGYSALHLSVLANKPELIIELLTKTQVDPMQEDNDGRAFLDMVFQHIPSYVETFQSILETLNVQRLKNQVSTPLTVVRHYVNADDERKLAVPKTEQEIQEMYAKDLEVKQEDEENQNQQVNLNSIEESDLQLQEGFKMDPRIEKVFGRKIAMCLISQNWQHKEIGMKYIYRATEKYLTKSESTQAAFTLSEMVDGSLAAVGVTCREKVIKVFNVTLQLFNMVVQSSRIERDIMCTRKLIQVLIKEQLIQQLLQYSEQANTRVTNKIHEALLDLSFQPQLGENLVTQAVYQQISKHNQTMQNHKGLLAQLALLYKLINSFTVHAEQVDASDSDEQKALTKDQILSVVLPSVMHSRDDIRGAASKILVDVQKQTKNITLLDLEQLSDKVKESVWDKLSETLMLITEAPTKLSVTVQAESNQKLTTAQFDKFKQIIQDKSKDPQQREQALNAIQECFSHDLNGLLNNQEEFLTQCTMLLQTSLDENNIQIYLIAVEVVLSFILKVPSSESVLDALPSLLQALVLKTTDTNTRVRKRSVEVINCVWDIQLNKKATQTASQMIAAVLTDAGLGQKAIVGRLGLFIKKALLIESSSDISKRPMHLILGKDYEQLAQFACQWCLHKDTKVRQCALKLTVEICRLNAIDPRGAPFKSRIVNYILGLRSSIRDPLVKKINEVCLAANPTQPSYLDESQLELSVATKARAASYDVRRVNRSGGQARAQALPSIGSGLLPAQADPGLRPTIVLPHSEPLSDAQLEQAAALIELFSKELVVCFYSQTWSSRFAAIQKVEEQLHNLDPQRRDAMTAEINKNNLPPEVSFKTFLKFLEEGLKDPVLKNYIAILELTQTALNFYFKYIRGEQIKREISPLVQTIIQKTSDLKQKVRESSMNICLYFSHQSAIGPEHMVSLVLGELDSLSWEKQEVKQSSFGNSNMIGSCLNLLAQFQIQTGLVTLTSAYYQAYATNLNKALKHSNPQVRKEGEHLFKTMFATYSDAYTKELKDQKAQLVAKLIADAKAESADKAVGQSKEQQDAVIKEQATLKMKDDYLNQPSILALLKGNEDKLQQLKQPNPKKRLIAIVEIKKIVQQKLTQVTQQTAKDLVEPFSLLLRHLLRDDNGEVYIEALNLLKFIVCNLAPNLSALDLHLMIGQFLTVIVSYQTQNIKARVQSDKVVVYFAKHANIGSVVVAKELLKSIERLNKSAFGKDEDLDDKKQTLTRLYSMLQILVQQFSIVLCYQPDFYAKCLDILSETLSKSNDEPTIKSTCHQLVLSLHQIDAKLLDQGVQKLDFQKKTHLKKILIELESSNKRGLVNQNLLSGIQDFRVGSPDASFRDTQQSFNSIQTRPNIVSPAFNMSRRLTRDRNSEHRASKDMAETPDNWRRMLTDQHKTEVNWLERKNTSTLPDITTNITNVADSQGSATLRRRQVGQGFVGGSNKAAGFNRNEFNMTGEYTRPNARGIMELTQGGGIGSSLLTAKPDIETIQPKVMSTLDSNRPPMYVPQQRVAIKRQDEGYQPTLIARANSQNKTSSSFATNNPMSSTISSMPPAASFEIKQAVEYRPRRQESMH